MRKLAQNQRGQFVIIVALLIAIMIISTGAILHQGVTYYKHEPWQEYSMLISNIELSSKHVVELSLINFTNSDASNRNPDTLRQNMESWQTNLTRMFPGNGAALSYTLPNGTVSLYGTAINFNSGLNITWENRSSFSASNANFTLNITSIGLEGYRFTTRQLLNVTFVGSPSLESGALAFNVTVRNEDGNPVTNLRKDLFVPYGFNYSTYDVLADQDQNQMLIYSIKCQNVLSMPSAIWLKMWDTRGILVIARYS